MLDIKKLFATHLQRKVRVQLCWRVKELRTTNRANWSQKSFLHHSSVVVRVPEHVLASSVLLQMLLGVAAKHGLVDRVSKSRADISIPDMRSASAHSACWYSILRCSGLSKLAADIKWPA